MFCIFWNTVIWNAVSVFGGVVRSTSGRESSVLERERAGMASRTRVVEAHQEREFDDFTVVHLLNHGPSHVHRSLIEEGFTENLVSDAYHDAISEHQARTISRTSGNHHHVNHHRSGSLGDPGDVAEPAAVIPTMNIQNSQYMGSIQVGEGVPAMDGLPEIPPVFMRVVFDTGSTNLWSSGAMCYTGACRYLRMDNSSEHPTLYDPAKSVTSNPVWRNLHPDYKQETFYKDMPKVEMSFVEGEGMFKSYNVHIKFGTGEISGRTIKDTVGIGKLHVRGQVFGMIDKEEGHIFDTLKEFGGIVGLAFPEMAAGGHKPLFDRAMEENVFNGNNQFSFYFGDGNQFSAFMVGGLAKALHQGDAKVAKVFQPHYWSMKLHKFSIDNGKEKKEFPVDDVVQIIIDSGTSGMTVPDTHLPSISAHIPPVPCSEVKNMGDMTFTVLMDPTKPADEPDNQVELVLQPQEYMLHSESRDRCTPAFWDIEVPPPRGPAFILGNHFMRHKTVVFHREGKDWWGNSYPAHMTFFDIDHDSPQLKEWVAGLENNAGPRDLAFFHSRESSALENAHSTDALLDVTIDRRGAKTDEDISDLPKYARSEVVLGDDGRATSSDFQRKRGVI